MLLLLLGFYTHCFSIYDKFSHNILELACIYNDLTSTTRIQVCRTRLVRKAIKSLVAEVMQWVGAQTFEASAVKPAAFSLVWRPLCGPGFGFWPLAKASRIFLVVSEVRSSYISELADNSSEGIIGTNIEIITHNQHRRIAACALTLNLYDGELAIFGCLSGVDTTEMFTHSVQDLRRAPEHAWGCRTYLNKMLANRLSEFM